MTDSADPTARTAPDLRQAVPEALRPVLARAEADWALRADAVVAQTAKGVVLRVRQQDGALAALKLLSEEGRTHEAQAPLAMEAYGGAGMVRALAATPEAQLIEWCAGPVLMDAPGGLRDDVAQPAVIEVATALRAAAPPCPQGVPGLERRLRALLTFEGAGASDQDARLLFDAQGLARQLLESTSDPVLLHADLHHENIMLHPARGWLAIDPQPHWGDRAYDLANLFCNPIEAPLIPLTPERPARLARALAQGLGLPEARVLGWAYVHAALSAVWALGGQDRHRMLVAQSLERCLGRGLG